MSFSIIFRHIITATLISTTVGCASIVSDSKYPVSITSTPSGADFEITNEDGNYVESGITPGHVTLKSGAGYFDGEKYLITYKKEGYSTTKNTLDTEINNWYTFGNLGFGGLIGYLIVDPATGAMYKLAPLSHTTMYPVKIPVTQAPNGAVPTKSKEQRVAELQAQNLSYTDYMQRIREIDAQP